MRASGPDPRDAAETELFRFVIPSRLEYRDAAKAFIAYICERVARRRALPEDLGHRVISAFVEAFNNAVIHGYEGHAGGLVEVELEVSAKKLSLKVIDEGRGFKPDAVPEPDLDALPEGGMGLFIMKSFMDSVDYRRVQGKNVLTMEKALGSERA
jgi:serine/threonine-protein kinase RsbW